MSSLSPTSDRCLRFPAHNYNYGRTHFCNTLLSPPSQIIQSSNFIANSRVGEGECVGRHFTFLYIIDTSSLFLLTITSSTGPVVQSKRLLLLLSSYKLPLPPILIILPLQHCAFLLVHFSPSSSYDYISLPHHHYNNHNTTTIIKSWYSQYFLR